MWCRRSALASNGMASPHNRGLAPYVGLPEGAGPGDPCNDVPAEAFASLEGRGGPNAPDLERHIARPRHGRVQAKNLVKVRSAGFSPPYALE